MTRRRLADAQSLQACLALALDLVVVWRVMTLTNRGRAVPDIPCTVFFEEAEGGPSIAIITAPTSPQQPRSLREAMAG